MSISILTRKENGLLPFFPSTLMCGRKAVCNLYTKILSFRLGEISSLPWSKMFKVWGSIFRSDLAPCLIKAAMREPMLRQFIRSAEAFIFRKRMGTVAVLFLCSIVTRSSQHYLASSRVALKSMGPARAQKTQVGVSH